MHTLIETKIRQINLFWYIWSLDCSLALVHCNVGWLTRIFLGNSYVIYKNTYFIPMYSRVLWFPGQNNSCQIIWPPVYLSMKIPIHYSRLISFSAWHFWLQLSPRELQHHKIYWFRLHPLGNNWCMFQLDTLWYNASKLWCHLVVYFVKWQEIDKSWFKERD